MILPENSQINHFDIGVCLAGGVDKIKVKKPLTSKFIPTGSELIHLGENHNKGDLIEFNSFVINGMLNDLGVITNTSHIIKDNKFDYCKCWFFSRIRRLHKRNNIWPRGSYSAWSFYKTRTSSYIG
jgi:putative molybdopterin biosynthesis protein